MKFNEVSLRYVTPRIDAEIRASRHWYFVDLSLFLFTILALLGFDSTKFSNSESGNVFHISDSTSNRCNIDWKCTYRLRKFCVMMHNMFSIESWSGLCAGHFIRVTSSFGRYTAIERTLFGPQLSSWSTTDAGPLWLSYINVRMLCQ